MLVEIPVDLTDDYYVILHMALEGIDIPELLVGRIRHSRPGSDKQYYAGLEFIIRECHKKVLPLSLLRNLPAKLFEFDDQSRKRLSEFLNENYLND
jgi:hypothetical protein